MSLLMKMLLAWVRMVCGSLSSPQVVSVDLNMLLLFLKRDEGVTQCALSRLLCTRVLKVPKQKSWCGDGSDLSDTGFIHFWRVFRLFASLHYF